MATANAREAAIRRTWIGGLLLFLLLLPAPVRAQTDGVLLHGALAGYLTLQGADLSITMYDLGQVRANPRVGLQEGNPIFAAFVAHPAAAGAFKLGIAAGTSWLLLHYHADHPRLAFWSAVAADSFYVWVVRHNTQLSGGLH